MEISDKKIEEKTKVVCEYLVYKHLKDIDFSRTLYIEEAVKCFVNYYYNNKTSDDFYDLLCLMSFYYSGLQNQENKEEENEINKKEIIDRSLDVLNEKIDMLKDLISEAKKLEEIK